MSCTGCKGLKRVTTKVTNIVEGYTNMVVKDPSIEKLYNERIAECNKCNKNISIPIARVHVCKICGCVLEAKTRVQDEHCPSVPSRW